MAAPQMTPGQMLDMMNAMQQPTTTRASLSAPTRVERVDGGVVERIKEVPVEVIKEVPVEVIKYVDREVCACARATQPSRSYPRTRYVDSTHSAAAAASPAAASPAAGRCRSLCRCWRSCRRRRCRRRCCRQRCCCCAAPPSL